MFKYKIILNIVIFFFGILLLNAVPVSHWPFEEGSNLTITDENGINDGTLVNGVAWTQKRRVDNYALFFDGTNDYINVGNNSSLNIGTENFTLNMWIFPDSLDIGTNTEECVFSKYENGNNRFYFRFRNAETVYFWAVVGGVTYYAVGDLNSGMDFIKGQWYMATFVIDRDDNNLKIYRNGVLAGTIPFSQNITDIDFSNSGDAKIGAYTPLSFYFNGCIDDVQIFNSALDSTEINDLLEDSGYLTCNFRFEEGNGTTTTDIASSITGSIYNASWTSGLLEDYALSFDGSYVDCGNDPKLNIGTENFTLNMWIFPNSLDIGTNTEECVFSKYENGNNRFYFRFRDAETVYFWAVVGGVTYYASGNLNSGMNFVNGQWYMATFIIDRNDNNLKIYRNGVLAGTIPFSQNITDIDFSNSGDAKIGAYTPLSFYFNGCIDDVRMYNYALGQTKITSLWTSSECGTIYYASPSGGGNGSSRNSPFTISQFLTTCQSGDVLILLDGIYSGENSMIKPPHGKSGKAGSYIQILAENEGAVIIDGENIREPVRFYGNNYWLLKGFNACRAGAAEGEDITSVINIRNLSHYNIFSRICAWDADPAINSYVFDCDMSDYNVFEDCAGWGSARKIFSHVRDKHTTMRRCFFRFTKHTSETAFWKLGMTQSYYSEDATIENCIGTWDDLPGTYQEQSTAIFGFDVGDEGDGGHRMYGCIGYHLLNQSGSLINIFFSNSYMHAFEIKDCVAYSDRDDVKLFNMPGNMSYASNLTGIGGSNGFLCDNVPSVDDCIFWGTDKTATLPGSKFVNISYWLNVNNYLDGEPTSYITVNPNSLATWSDIFQSTMSQSERPLLQGKPLGGQVRYRYHNGVLTDEPLWPWPMNKRIEEALVQSGYSIQGGIDGNGAVDVTELIMSLGTDYFE